MPVEADNRTQPKTDTGGGAPLENREDLEHSAAEFRHVVRDWWWKFWGCGAGRSFYSCGKAISRPSISELPRFANLLRFVSIISGCDGLSWCAIPELARIQVEYSCLIKRVRVDVCLHHGVVIDS